MIIIDENGFGKCDICGKVGISIPQQHYCPIEKQNNQDNALTSNELKYEWATRYTHTRNIASRLFTFLAIRIIGCSQIPNLHLNKRVRYNRNW